MTEAEPGSLSRACYRFNLVAPEGPGLSVCV